LRNNERNAAHLATATPQQVTPASLNSAQNPSNSGDDSKRGTDDLTTPVDPISRSNANGDEISSGINGKINDGLKTGEDENNNKNIDDNFLSDEPPRDNLNGQGHCGCDSDKMKIILPQSDGDSCNANRMAKIAIPIAAEKLSAVPMRELMDLSSAKGTMDMLKNLQNLCEKYHL
jgi:hypothetical protein